MADPLRAVLTDYERDCLAGKREKQLEYLARSRVRKRIEGPLAEDIAHLEEHDPGLLDELLAVVCDRD